MAGLSVLRTRTLANPEAEKMAYMKALDGVTKYGLEQAVDNILRGSLGDDWMPSPPALRIQIDEVMRPIKEARARDQKERRILEEQARDRKRRGMTPEQRQRANEKWQTARAAMKMQTEEENAYEAALSRLQAASEANGNDFNLDRITNATTGPFKQVGRARG
jgi:hypothetical protein